MPARPIPPTPPPLLSLDPHASLTAELLSADEAARRLGVRKASLYAYASRGLLTAVPDAHDPRARRYSSFEVALLQRRKGRPRRQLQQSLATVNEGWPLLDTALSCVADGVPRYRGHSALALAEHASVEDVACLLWQCEPHQPFAGPPPQLGARWMATARELARRPLQERTLTLLALAQPALHGPPWLTDPAALALACGQHLRAAIACFLARAPSDAPLHQQFVRAWRLPQQAAEPLRQALVLAADHELNMVAFIGRALSSVGASLGAALLGAMCSLSGSFNGGATEQIEALWDELASQRDPFAALARRLQAGTGLPGFNHMSYPGGDPRAALLLAACEGLGRQPGYAAAVERLTGWKPSIDYALVALRRTLGAPRNAAMALQMGGRCVGVIAHALEQRRSGQRLIVRARYVGPAAA